MILLAQTCSLPSPAVHTLGWLSFFGVIGAYWSVVRGYSWLTSRRRISTPLLESSAIVLVAEPVPEVRGGLVAASSMRTVHRKRIIETIRTAADPLTCKQIAKMSGLNHMQVNRRITEFRREGVVMVAGNDRVPRYRMAPEYMEA